MSKKVTYWDNFKPNFKSARAFMLYTVIPIAAFAYFLDKDRSAKEHMYRTGQVAYADRRFKYQ